jgi:hypothetical protein
MCNLVGIANVPYVNLLQDNVIPCIQIYFHPLYRATSHYQIIDNCVFSILRLNGFDAKSGRLAMQHLEQGETKRQSNITSI